MKKTSDSKIVEGKLESQVMSIVWEKKHCSPKEVATELGNKQALTTISTVLERLSEKGLLQKTKVGGKVTFTPAVSQKAYSDSIVKQFMNKIVNSFGDVAVSSFAKGVDQLPVNKRKELVELLNKYEK
jgi:predicted transcriptional regulator